MQEDVKVVGPSVSIFSEERKDLGDLDGFRTPPPTVQCASCRYAIRGKYGYRNGKCYKYQGEKGKPNDILFKGAKCQYYRKDRSNSNKEETK